MAWGDPGVSKNLRLSNGATAWGTGGTPTTVPIQQTGILRGLRMLVNGATTYTAGGGTIALDKLGPWNIFSNLTLSPNQQAPIINLSGYGLYLANVMRAIDRQTMNTPDTTSTSVSNAETSTDIYSAPVTTSTLRLYEDIPITQQIKSLGGEFGFWPLQNPAIQLQFSFTPNSASSGSPFNIFSTTANAAPYLVTGAATMTLTSPTTELIRDLYQVPVAAADFPPFNLVTTWIEESPQGASVGGATSATWQATPLSGLLLRVGAFILDSGNSNNGIAASNLTASNALQLTYDNNTPKYAESSYAALARQRSYFGFDLPQGFYVWDLLGKNQTLQDVLDTNTVGNIKLQFTFTNALGSTSSIKIVRQILSPLEVK